MHDSTDFVCFFYYCRRKRPSLASSRRWENDEVWSSALWNMFIAPNGNKLFYRWQTETLIGCLVYRQLVRVFVRMRSAECRFQLTLSTYFLQELITFKNFLHKNNNLSILLLVCQFLKINFRSLPSYDWKQYKRYILGIQWHYPLKLWNKYHASENQFTSTRVFDNFCVRSNTLKIADIVVGH